MKIVNYITTWLNIHPRELLLLVVAAACALVVLMPDEDAVPVSDISTTAEYQELMIDGNACPVLKIPTYEVLRDGEIATLTAEQAFMLLTKENAKLTKINAELAETERTDNDRFIRLVSDHDRAINKRDDEHAIKLLENELKGQMLTQQANAKVDAANNRCEVEIAQLQSQHIEARTNIRLELRKVINDVKLGNCKVESND